MRRSREPRIGGSPGSFPTPAPDADPAQPAPALSVALLVSGLGFLVLYGWLVRSDFPFIHPDTSSYVAFDPSRPLGYPLLLWLTRMVSGGHGAVVWVQLPILVAGAALLAREVGIASRWWVAGLACMVGICANVELMKYAFAALSDAAFTSCVMVVGAMGLRFLRMGSWQAMAWCAVFIGFAGALRTVGLALAPLVAILLLMRLDQVRIAPVQAFVAAFAPLVLVTAIAQGAHSMVHAGKAPAHVLGVSLLGKMAFVPAEPSVSRYPAISGALESAIAPLRDVASGLDPLLHEYLFKTNYYDRFRFQMYSEARAGAPGRPPAAGEDVAMTIAIEHIRANPAGYARDVAINLYAMLTLADSQTPRVMRGYVEAVAARVPDPGGIPPYVRPPGRRPVLVYTARAGLVAANALLAVAALGWLVRVRSAARTLNSDALAFIGLGVWGYQLAVALVQVGAPRYSLVIWPLQVSALVLAGTWVAGRLRARVRA